MLAMIEVCLLDIGWYRSKLHLGFSCLLLLRFRVSRSFFSATLHPGTGASLTGDGGMRPPVRISVGMSPQKSRLLKFSEYISRSFKYFRNKVTKIRWEIRILGHVGLTHLNRPPSENLVATPLPWDKIVQHVGAELPRATGLQLLQFRAGLALNRTMHGEGGTSIYRDDVICRCYRLLLCFCCVADCCCGFRCNLLTKNDSRLFFWGFDAIGTVVWLLISVCCTPQNDC